MNDQPTKDVSVWKPTEDELVSLGFKSYPTGCTLTGTANGTSFRIAFCHMGTFENGAFWNQDTRLYPKSLEELKTLISMMKT